MIVFIVHRSTGREKAHAHTCAKESTILTEKISEKQQRWKRVIAKFLIVSSKELRLISTGSFRRTVDRVLL